MNEESLAVWVKQRGSNSWLGTHVEIFLDNGKVLRCQGPNGDISMDDEEQTNMLLECTLSG